MATSDWQGLCQMVEQKWTCGYCGRDVGNNVGYYQADDVLIDKINKRPSQFPGFSVQQLMAHSNMKQVPSQFITADMHRIVICPSCERPTFFDGESQMPGAVIGSPITNLPGQIGALYDEVRKCFSVCAFTASVLLARKMLMNVAVHFNADPGKTFHHYVDFLVQNGYVPQPAKGWVDHIRNKGNEATHEIPSISESDARDLLLFMEMILKCNFEYPARASGS